MSTKRFWVAVTVMLLMLAALVFAMSKNSVCAVMSYDGEVCVEKYVHVDGTTLR